MASRVIGSSRLAGFHCVAGGDPRLRRHIILLYRCTLDIHAVQSSSICPPILSCTLSLILSLLSEPTTRRQAGRACSVLPESPACLACLLLYWFSLSLSLSSLSLSGHGSSCLVARATTSVATKRPQGTDVIACSVNPASPVSSIPLLLPLSLIRIVTYTRLVRHLTKIKKIHIST